MKELWSYMAPGFTNYAKYLKKIKNPSIWVTMRRQL